MSSVRGKWFITSSFNSYSTRLSRMKTERAIWFLLTAQTCQMEIQRDHRLTGPSKHLHASLCLIWVAQNNPSQQGWPRCFTDDSIKGFTFYLPSLQFHVTAHDGSSGWAAPHCDHQTPPKNRDEGSKPCVLFPHGADIRVCQRNRRRRITVNKVSWLLNLRTKYEE